MGLIAAPLFIFLNIGREIGVLWWHLAWVIPLLWVLGVYLGYKLSRFFPWLFQFSKFAAVGFSNAAVDFGVLNILIFTSGAAAGILFSVFKTVSFIAATINSYFWNKFWTFEAGKTGVGTGEFAKFLAVSVVGVLVNVGFASAVVNLTDPQFGFNPEQWANVGAVVGSATALIWNFLGYKLIVFKK